MRSTALRRASSRQPFNRRKARWSAAKPRSFLRSRLWTGRTICSNAAVELWWPAIRRRPRSIPQRVPS